jgi:hypothetical protein
MLAAHIARAFGLAGNPPDAAATSRNKLASRRALQAAGLATPWFNSFPTTADIRALAGAFSYPAVVKPLALSGSRGVMRVDTPRECVAAFERLRQLLRAPDVRSERDEVHDIAVIEGFIPGREFAVEGLLDRGTLRVLAVFDKPDPLDGPLFEETIYVTPSRAPDDVLARMSAAVAGATAALGLHHGPVHAEVRVDPSAPDGPVYVLEVAARPIGGLCSRALRFRTGAPSGGLTGHREHSLEEILLRHAIGEDVSGYEREPAAAGVMMVPIPQRGIYRSVECDDEARAVAGVEDVVITAKPDALLVPLPEGKSYLGFIFARGERPEAVEAALRAAHARLRFTIEREIPVV